MTRRLRFATAVLVMLLPGRAVARKAGHLTFTTPPFFVRARSDLEQWAVLRIPAHAPLDIAGMEMDNLGGGPGFGTHHMRAYTAREDTTVFGLLRFRKHWSTYFNFVEAMNLIGGSQSVRKRQVAADGLALHLPAVALPGKKRRYLWIAIDSHWVNGTDVERRGRVRIILVPAVRPVKRLLKPIFEGTANAGIFVPQGTVRSTEDSTRALNDRLAASGVPLGLNDSWGPGVLGVGDLVPGSGALPTPAGPACVTFLTAHMHLRGRLFAVDFIDSDGQVKNGEPRPYLENPFEPGRYHLFVSTLYDDPAEIHFDPPRYVVPGQRFHYACWHDNGVVAPPKLSCEEVPGVTPGQPIGDSVLGSGTTGPSTPCHQEGPDEAECPLSGNCVRANLVFGPTGDDDMCILPGAYYDPNPTAPPGHECDLALMPPLS
jgi:hypothetical protein